MSFEHTWITGDSDAPADQAATADALRSFANDDATYESAAALQSLDADALIALAEVLTERQDGARLALLKAAALPKKARKVVGKAIHKLKTRGIECEAPTGRVGGMTFHRDELPTYMSAPDPYGMQFILMGGTGSHGYPEACYAVAGADGIADFAMISEPSKSRLKKFAREIEENPTSAMRYRFTEVPAALARTRLNEAAAIVRASEAVMPEDFAEAQDLLAGETIDRASHPVWGLMSAADASLTAQAETLLGDVTEHDYRPGPADRPPIDDEPLDALQDQFESIVHGDEDAEEKSDDEKIDDETKRARVIEAIDTFIGEYFTEARRQRESTRLLDTAFILHKLGDRDVAAIALAVSEQLLDTDTAPGDILWLHSSVHGLFDIEHILHHTHDHDHEHDHDH